MDKLVILSIDVLHVGTTNTAVSIRSSFVYIGSNLSSSGGIISSDKASSTGCKEP
jgi:hypothetical protein